MELENPNSRRPGNLETCRQGSNCLWGSPGRRVSKQSARPFASIPGVASKKGRDPKFHFSSYFLSVLSRQKALSTPAPKPQTQKRRRQEGVPTRSPRFSACVPYLLSGRLCLNSAELARAAVAPAGLAGKATARGSSRPRPPQPHRRRRKASRKSGLRQ